MTEDPDLRDVVDRGPPHRVVAGVLRRDGRVLLVHRSPRLAVLLGRAFTP